MKDGRGASALLLTVLLASAIPFLGPLLRGEVFSFRDHADYFIPLRYFTAQALRAGELPLWNPFNGSGERWLANPQTGVFYPPFWIFLMLPFAAAYVVYLWLHVLVLGLGAYRLFSRWASRAASLIGAVALMLCGPTLSLLDISNNLATLSWLPLVLDAAVERTKATPRVPKSIDVLLITLMFLGGEPFLAAVGAMLYATILIFSAGETPFRKRLAALLFVAVLSLLLSAAQLVPFLELLKGSDRVTGAVTVRESMLPRDWLASVVPPADPIWKTRAIEVSQRYIFSIYLGLPIVFGAAAAATAAHRLSRQLQLVVASWTVLFLLAVVFSAGTEFPLSRYPSRLASVAALAVAALATIGLDCLEVSSKRWRLSAMAGLGIFAAIALLIFAPLDAPSWRLIVVSGWVVLLALLLARPHAPLLLVPLIVLDFAIAAQPLLWTRPLEPRVGRYAEILQPPYKIARLLGRDTSLRTEDDRRAWLSGYLNLLIRRFDAWSPAPVVSANYLRLHDTALFGPRVDVVDFLSIRYLATTRDIRHPAYQPIDRIGAVTLFRNGTVLPVTAVWSSYGVTENSEQAFSLIMDSSNSARRIVYVSCRPGERCRIPESNPSDSAPGAASASFSSLNELIADISVPTTAVLTVSQLDAPGWKVEIDGAAAKPLRANGLFRAVLVPGGSHRVTWRYRPRSIGTGITMSTIALVVMIGEIIYVCRRRGRAVIF